MIRRLAEVARGVLVTGKCAVVMPPAEVIGGPAWGCADTNRCGPGCSRELPAFAAALRSVSGDATCGSLL